MLLQNLRLDGQQLGNVIVHRSRFQILGRPDALQLLLQMLLPLALL